jgi:hypothetical protein
VVVKCRLVVHESHASEFFTYQIRPVLFFVSKININPGPVKRMPRIGKENPKATQIMYS